MMDAPNLSARVFVKLTSDHVEIFSKMRRYLDYLNHVIDEQTGSALYIEEMINGFVYVYKNIEVMKKMNDPNNPYINSVASTNLGQNPELKDQDAPVQHFFLSSNLTSESFPEEGIHLYFETSSEPSEEILRHLVNFIKKNQDNDFSIHYIERNKVEVLFSSYDAFKIYCDNVERLFAYNL